MKGGATNEAVVKEYTETLKAKLKAYEVILSKQKYLAGDVCFILYNVLCHELIISLGGYAGRPLPSSIRCIYFRGEPFRQHLLNAIYIFSKAPGL